MFPIYKALITDDLDGMINLSLVDCPAVESNFIAFDKQHQPLQFLIQDEEQRMILGVVMRADFPIYRFSPDMGEYYVVYEKNTIEQMVQKLFKDNLQNSINIMHQENSNVNGVEMVECFIKNTEKGISPIGFEDIEEGSLFARFHVLNDEVWEQIKSGTFVGFSLEGYFKLDKKEIEQNMSIKSKITKALVKFGEIKTDKEVLYWVGEEDLKEGDEVFVGEEQTPAPDGDYVTEDGKTIKVVEGKVSEIVDPEAEVESEEEKEEEVKAVEEPVEETIEPIVEEVVYVSKEEFEELRAQVEELRTLVDALVEEIRKPVAEPIVEEFKKVEKREYNGAARIVSAIRK